MEETVLWSIPPCILFSVTLAHLTHTSRLLARRWDGEEEAQRATEAAGNDPVVAASAEETYRGVERLRESLERSNVHLAPDPLRPWSVAPSAAAQRRTRSIHDRQPRL